MRLKLPRSWLLAASPGGLPPPEPTDWRLWCEWRHRGGHPPTSGGPEAPVRAVWGGGSSPGETARAAGVSRGGGPGRR
eukprot:8163572-Alexandrium_andersonii.AAC.1